MGSGSLNLVIMKIHLSLDPRAAKFRHAYNLQIKHKGWPFKAPLLVVSSQTVGSPPGCTFTDSGHSKVLLWNSGYGPLDKLGTTMWHITSCSSFHSCIGQNYLWS